jgi:hypothetical protein
MIYMAFIIGKRQKKFKKIKMLIQMNNENKSNINYLITLFATYSKTAYKIRPCENYHPACLC